MVQSAHAAAAFILNTDWAVNVPVPLSPHVFAVGALNPDAAQPLPTELQGIYDSAGPDGVVYISTGSTAMPGALPSTLSERWLTHVGLSRSVDMP